MSRVGKKPVVIPAGVTAKLDGQNIAVKGAKGELKFAAPDDVVVSLEGNVVKVDPRSQTKRARAMWGMSRAMIANLVAGVTREREWRPEDLRGVELVTRAQAMLIAERDRAPLGQPPVPHGRN